MKHILVTGGKGQLAQCINKKADNLKEYRFTYVDLDELDITKKAEVDRFFDESTPDWCVNCAAYTAVDKAESEHDLAKQVNAVGAKYLAEASKKHGAIFVQISTDFVFDGKQGSPYTEADEVSPLSVYGSTKLEGEYAVAKVLPEHFIIRTSWLYSEYGHNFLKTMLRLGDEREELNVVCDQIGTPTYAGDLAGLILKLITSGSNAYGTYHFSNEGVASWYDFAQAIFDESGTKVKVSPIKSEAFPQPARRPAFSVMDKSKIKEGLKIEIPYWRDSLKRTLKRLYED